MAKGLRGSAMDKLVECPPSVLADGPEVIRISSLNYAAILGRAVHEMGAQLITDDEYDLMNVCARHGITDSDAVLEAETLMTYAERSWEELKQYFPTPQVEKSITADPITVDGVEYVIAGTIDCLSPIGRTDAIFLDWKSGFIDDGYNQQMTSYAYCLWCWMGRPPSTTITGVVVFLRHHYHRIVKFKAQQLADWEHDLCHNVLSKPDTYQPGKGCRYCDMYTTCPARKAVVEGTLDSLMFGTKNKDVAEFNRYLGEAKELLAQLTVVNKNNPTVGKIMADLMFRIRLAERAIMDTKNLIKDAVARVGAIDLRDGTSIFQREMEKREILPAKAFNILRRRMDDAEICKAVKFSLPKLLQVYTDRFKRGEKKAAREQLTEALLEGGALTLHQTSRIELIDTAHLNSLEGKEPEND